MHYKCKSLAVVLLSIAAALLSPLEMLGATQATSGTKDPTALAALAQMVAATGWNPLNLPADAVVTGAVTRTSDQVTSAVTLKIKGFGEFRADVQNSGVTSTIVNNGQAAQVLPDGTSRILATQDALSTWPVDLPLFSNLALAASAQNISVSYLGTETVGSSLCNKIQISTQIQGNDPISQIASRVANVTIWLDTTTALPAQIQYTRLATNNANAGVSHTRQFSNYQAVNGIQVAFSQQEFVNVSLLYTLQLSTVTFNVGLQDSDFAFPTAQQGGF